MPSSYSAEAGSAWTLLYPAYTVAIPQPDVLAVPLAYPMAPGDQEMVDFINLWLELKKKDKTITSLYDYWILGKNAVPTAAALVGRPQCAALGQVICACW